MSVLEDPQSTFHKVLPENPISSFEKEVDRGRPVSAGLSHWRGERVHHVVRRREPVGSLLRSPRVTSGYLYDGGSGRTGTSSVGTDLPRPTPLYDPCVSPDQVLLHPYLSTLHTGFQVTVHWCTPGLWSRDVTDHRNRGCYVGSRRLFLH